MEDEKVVTAARIATIRIDGIFLVFTICGFKVVGGVLKGCIKQIKTKRFNILHECDFED